MLCWSGRVCCPPLASHGQDSSRWPWLPASQWDAAQFGMKNAQAGKAGKVGFSLKWHAMNNQQEEQEVGAVETGGKFLSQKPVQALSFLKEKSPVCFFTPSLRLE